MAATNGGAGVPQDQRAAEDQTGAGRAAAGEVATRASDRERDAVVQRVQDAFAEGRLNDDEFDERSRAGVPPCEGRDDHRAGHGMMAR